MPRLLLFISLFLSLQSAGQSMMEWMEKALNHFQKQEYAEAIPAAEKAAEEVKKLMGEENVFYQGLLTVQATSHSRIYHYLEAEAIWLKLKNLLSKNKQSQEYATCLNNLAAMYNEMGVFEKSEPLLLESMEITKRMEGEDSTYTYSLNNLAALYHSMGLYSKAEPLYIKSVEIRKRVFGLDHPDYATSLNNLGTLYVEMGQYEKSEPYFIQSAAIRKKALGDMHRDYAMSLNNLAAVYEDMLEYPKAEALYVQSQDIKRKVLGESHPDYAMGLNNLAGLYVKMNQFPKAEAAMFKARDIWKQVLGDRHPNYATALNNLGALLRRSKSRYDQSEKFYLQGIALRKELLGPSHPLTADTENDMALLYSNMKQYNKAAAYLLSSTRSMLGNMMTNFTVLSEKEKARYLDYNFVYLETNNSLLYNDPNASADLLKSAFDLQLAYKSLSLSDTRNMLERVRNSKDTVIARIFKDWQTSRLILAHQYSLPVENRMPGLDLVEAKAESLEKELGRRSAEFRDQQNSLQVNMNQVQDKLESDEAAIEFVRFRLYTDQWSDSTIYAAFVLRKQDKVPVFVPLCRENDLDRISASGGRSATNLAKVLYRSLEVSSKAMPGDSLYALVWKPLEKHLTGIRKISYSPAGKLYGIAFHALPGDSSRLLLDKYQLQQYTSTRQIALRGSVQERKQPGNIILFGDALFTMDSLQLVRKKSTNPVKDLGSAPILAFTRAESAGTWNNLPGTGQEVKQVSALFDQRKVPNRAFTQADASEENMKALDGQSPTILHVATHGFFLPEPKSRPGSEGNAYSLAKDPLLRSGLVLAGANYTWSGKKPLAGIEDGITTAYEISQLDLSRTDLVVLSACETGLGDVKGSEGVFGLQRSFKMAGVKNLVVSLWQVPDKETVELMTTFYSYRLEGKSISESFNLAQAAMRKKYSPFYWAAFILVE